MLSHYHSPKVELYNYCYMEEVISHSEIIYTHLGISLSPQNPLGCEPRSFHLVSVEVSLHDLNFMEQNNWEDLGVEN